MRSVLLAASLAFALSACGASSIDKSRQGLALVATGLKAVDSTYAQAYDARINSIKESDNYVEIMEPWDDGVEAIRKTKLGLLLAEDVLDAWESGDSTESHFKGVAACALGLFGQVADVMDRVGLKDLAGTVRQTLKLGGAIIGVSATCEVDW